MSGNFLARIGLVCFACGVILLYRLTVLPPPTVLSLVTGLAFLAAFLGRRFLGTGRRHSLWFMPGLFLAGLSWAAWHADGRLDTRLPSYLDSQELEGQPLEISGYLCGVPEPGSFQSVRFPVCVSRWHGEWAENHEHRLPKRLRLAWYGDGANLQIPARLRLTAVLKKPHGALNPRGFRYESWLFRHDYGATGSVRELAEDTSVRCNLECQYHQWRTSTVAALSGHLKNLESGPLIMSLMLGYRGLLEPEHWQVLKATGTIHLVAISGLHLGLVAIGAGFLIRRCLIWLPESFLSPARFRLLLFLLVSLTSLAYALAAGFSVPTRRALIMVVVGCWWVLNARQTRPLDGVLVALFLVLLFDPLSPLDQGFWLSFGAVFILTVVFGGMLRTVSWWRSLLLAQLAIFAALWPILAILDQSQPLVGFLANLVAIPLVSLLIMPAVFLCALVIPFMPGIAHIPIAGLDLLIEGLWRFLGEASEMELPSLMPAVPELIVLALLVAMALAIPLRSFRIVLALSFSFWFGATGSLWANANEIKNSGVEHPEIWIWDVGQGVSVLVREKGRVLLYDTGPEFEGLYSAAESVLVPNLRALGVQSIDTLIISHADNDHSGGIGLLLEHFDVGRIISGEPAKIAWRLATRSVPPILPCQSDSPSGKTTLATWQHVGGTGHIPDGNDASCVVVLSFNDRRQQILLTGDISREAEQAFMDDNPALVSQKPEFRAVMAPHHGSKTSSSRDWVTSLAPDLVLFSAGYRHRYGHPHPDIVARYAAAESRLLNTATSGAIHLVFKPEGVIIEESRHSAPFWIERYR